MPRLAGPKRNGIGFAKKSSRRGNASGWPVRSSPSTARCRPVPQVVPSEVFKPDGSVDDQATAGLLEISLPVTLSRQQVREEDLSSALLQFRRRAIQVGQLEDWFIFNGTYPSIELSPDGRAAFERRRRRGIRLPPGTCPSECLGLQSTGPYKWHPEVDRGRGSWPTGKGHASAQSRVAGVDRRFKCGSSSGRPRRPAEAAGAGLDNKSQTLAIVVDAINSLENNGYVAPYVRVFGRETFQDSLRPPSKTRPCFRVTESSR